MTSGSVTSAITRSRPPQCGHTVISIPNTRRSRSAQVSGAFGGRAAGRRVTLALDTAREGSLEVQIDLGQSLLSPADYLELTRADPSIQDVRLRPILATLTDGLVIVADGGVLPREYVSAEFVADSIEAIRNPLTPQMATLRWRVPATTAEVVDVRLVEALDVPWPCLVRVDSSRRDLPVSRLLTADRRASVAVDLRDGGARDAAAGGATSPSSTAGWASSTSSRRAWTTRCSSSACYSSAGPSESC